MNGCHTTHDMNTLRAGIYVDVINQREGRVVCRPCAVCVLYC